MIDWTISVGNILTVLGMIIGAGGLMFAIGKMTQRFEGLTEDVAGFRSEVSDLKDEVKKQNDILSAIAVQNNRLDTHDKLIDELRRGEGYVLPLRKSAFEVP